MTALLTPTANTTTVPLRVSVFACMLAAAGLPLYIHLPLYASNELGIGLATLGGLLGLLRLLDVVEDPALGWLVDRFPRLRSLFAILAAVMMAAGFLILFASPLPKSIGWFIAALCLVFTGYSLGTILFYGQTAALARGSEAQMLRLAGFREFGSLTGVILAASAPAAFLAMGARDGGYGAFGLALACLCLGAVLLSRPLWNVEAARVVPLSLTALRRSGALRLLGIAFLNSLPVAITSTLFLFFVEDRLELPQLAGPFLILFFLAAGLSVPLWTRAAQALGPRRVLMPAMSLAILAFVGAGFLGPSDGLGFALICIGSGAALGADMVLLPLMFSLSLSRAGLAAGQAFGLWSFAAKLSLAGAAVLALPLLSQAGYQPGIENDATALRWLTLAYAVIPCLIKLLAILLVARLPRDGALT